MPCCFIQEELLGTIGVWPRAALRALFEDHPVPDEKGIR